jgi:glycosyltransferase involved in cell wall biosynthesis
MSATAERFDVLLPTHRRPHTLPHAIAGVLAQTHADFTLHVIGDGCSDATEAVVRSFEDPRVRWHRFPKAYGFGYENRNKVLAQTNAPYIAYMTDDDLWFPDHLERGLAELRERKLDLVAFRSVHVQFPDLFDPHFFAFDWRLAGAGVWLRNWFMGSVSCLHRRSVFDVVGYWNDKLVRFGDREFYNRVRTSPAPSAYVDYPTVLRFYAQHWDTRYHPADEPPQKRYFARLRDPQWQREIATACSSGKRGARVRARQWQDFMEFGMRSGPRFVRFWWQKALRR